MNVVVPYSNLRAETATVASAVNARFVDTSGSEDAYWHLLLDLWNRRRATFALLEHDIVPPPGALDEIWACPEPWCGVPYPVGRIWGVWFGCTKFSRSLILKYPEAVRSIREHSWNALDAQLISYLHRREPGGPHWHWPAAEHLNRTSVPDGQVFANCGDCGGPLRFEDLRGGPEVNRCPRCGRIPNHFQPVRERPVRRRLDLATALVYVGNGRYLNGVPAADFESDDEALIAECLDSELYVVAPAAPKKSKAKPEADAPADPVTVSEGGGS